MSLLSRAEAQSSVKRQGDGLNVARVNGVALHYLDRGSGVPVIFVHGALDDYRMWEGQIGPFSRSYRVIAYSRRYNYPNANSHIRPDHSAIVEAEDLVALIRKLGLSRAHIVSHSYGALTALFLAVKHPEMIRSLVLAEAPVIGWTQGTPEGRALYAEFMKGLWKPAGDALRKGEKERALRVTMKYFVGGDAYDHFPPQARQALRSNLREWKALTTSSDPFPAPSRAVVRRITVPVLMVSGAKTLKILKYLDDQLQPLLRHSERVIIPNSTHEMWADNPGACRGAVLAFLRKN